MLTRLLPTITGIFLVFGLSLVSGGTTSFLQGQVAGVPAYQGETFQTGKFATGETVHPVAIVAETQADQAGRILFVGMLMILAAFLLYTMYVVRMQREAAEHSPLSRMRHWFQLHLDRRVLRMH